MGQVSLSIKYDSSFVQDELASRKNCCLLANLTEVSGIPDSIGEGSRSSVPALASCSAENEFTNHTLIH